MIEVQNLTHCLGGRTILENVNLTLNEGSVAVISKSGSPCIHFAIRHPLLRNALENMVVAVAEAE